MLKIGKWKPPVESSHDSAAFWGLVANFLLIIILVVLVIFKLRPARELTAIHYNVLIGVDVVAAGWRMYALPVLAAFIFGVNMFAARKFSKFEPLAGRILLMSSLVVSAVLVGAALSLTSLY